MRTPKALLIASKEFASEDRQRSWRLLGSTLLILAVLIGISVSPLVWAVRIPASVLSGLVLVRLFVIYHDHQHRAILHGSWLAGVIMRACGLVLLNPSSVWNRSHDHHHKNNSKSFGASIGSYPIMTTDSYASALPHERLAYRVARHPLTMLFGYVTVFAWGMSLRPFLKSPRRHFDGGLAIVVHGVLCAGLASFGWDVMLLGLVLPCAISSCLGAYLFYAQHNFPSARLQPRADWSHVEAALRSSSFIKMGPLMNWFTGNIGYHHVHHLNAKIPFYRLPEAMAVLPELQSPGTTTLRPADILACLRLKLWSLEEDRLVSGRGR